MENFTRQQKKGGEQMAITLKAARVNKGLTQAQAAEILGVSADIISNWERGKSFPKVPEIQRIETLYGVNYADIIFLPCNNG